VGQIVNSVENRNLSLVAFDGYILAVNQQDAAEPVTVPSGNVSAMQQGLDRFMVSSKGGGMGETVLVSQRSERLSGQMGKQKRNNVRLLPAVNLEPLTARFTHKLKLAPPDAFPDTSPATFWTRKFLTPGKSTSTSNYINLVESTV